MGIKVSNDVMFDELCDEEGLKLSVYRCPSGHLTVGVGHNLAVEPCKEILGKTLKYGDVITRAQALSLFEYDIERILKDLTRRIPWFLDLSGPRQYVVISLSFNMGVPGFMKFKNALRHLHSGNILKTCEELKSSRWYHQVGKRGPKLIKIMERDTI